MVMNTGFWITIMNLRIGMRKFISEITQDKKSKVDLELSQVV